MHARAPNVCHMRLATWNLLHGVGIRSGAGAVDSDMLHAAIKELSPDIIGLQEVDTGQERSSGAHQTQIVADAMGAQWWQFAPTVHGTPGEEWHPATADDAHTHHDEPPTEPQYGIGFATRFPVIEHRNITVSGAQRSMPLLVPTPAGNRLIKVADEPRSAIAAVLDTPRGVISVATAHLSFVPGTNIKQLRTLTKWLADLPRPLFLIGDFNLPGRIPAIMTRWKPLAKAATYPSWKPLVQFDHILTDGWSNPVRAIHVMPLPVSDHCALGVDL